MINHTFKLENYFQEILYLIDNWINKAAYEFIKAILEEYDYCKIVMKKHLIISEEEEQYQLSNAFRICEKLIDHDDEKVRDHCHVTVKF